MKCETVARWGTFAVAAVIASALAACPRAAKPSETPVAPAAPPPPAPIHVPSGCEANQSGEWVHSQNASYRYLARDDGGTLELALLRTVSEPDAGGWEISDAELSTF